MSSIYCIMEFIDFITPNKIEIISSMWEYSNIYEFFVIKTLKNFYGRHKISFGRIACSGIQKAQAPLRKEQCLCFGGQRPGTRKCCACVSTRVSGSSPLAASIWAGGTWNRRAISNSASPSCA